MKARVGKEDAARPGMGGEIRRRYRVYETRSLGRRWCSRLPRLVWECRLAH
jgi:hypothetical protein